MAKLHSTDGSVGRVVPLVVASVLALGITSAVFAAQNPAPVPPDAADSQAGAPSSASQPAQSPDPDAASSPHQRDVTKKSGTEETSPTSSPEPEGASSPHQRGAIGETPNSGMAGADAKIVGFEVRSPTGEALGSVIDVVTDANKRPSYAVISTGNDTATAVPYATAASMVKGQKVVVDRARLENSPQVAQSELADKANTKWRADADKYWSSLRSASPGDPRNTARER